MNFKDLIDIQITCIDATPSLTKGNSYKLIEVWTEQYPGMSLATYFKVKNDFGVVESFHCYRFKEGLI